MGWMLPLEYNQSMKTALLLIAMLALSLAQTTTLSNCFIANLNTSLCIKCNDGYLLSQTGTCRQCVQGYQLVNNICTLATTTTPTTTATAATATTNAAVQSTASTTNINANINDIIANPTLLAALLAYIQGLNSGTNTLVVSNPCASVVNNVCTSCTANFVLVNGVCRSSTTTTTTTSTTTPTSTQTTTSTPSTSSNSSTSSSSSSAATMLPGLTTTTTSNTPVNSAQATTTTTSTATTTSGSGSSNVVFLPFYTSVTTSNPTTSTDNPPTSNYTDPNCKTLHISLTFCSECYSGFYYNSFSKACIATNPLCQSVTNTNICLSCYQGYVLYFGNCVKALSNCKSINANNACTACFDGYDLINATCQLKNETALSQMDQFCSNFSNGSCVTCVTRYYLSPSGRCMQVDPNCQNYTNSGVCQLCYIGFKYMNGICMKYDFDNFWFNIPSSNAIQCVFRSVNINGVCVRVNDQCATWSNTTALCTGCYRGYGVVNGACVLNAG